MKAATRNKFIALALILLVGLYATDRLLMPKRDIASFEGLERISDQSRVFDIADLPEKEFYKAFKLALVQGLQLQKENQGIGLFWGQFLVRNSSGSKVYACERYPQFEITLQAEGVAYSGEVPTLDIQGPCLSSDDGQKILPFLIPLKQLHKSLREQAHYKVPMQNERGDYFTISAKNLYNEWPQYWNVVGVKLANETENLSMDGYEIISLLDQVLTLDFADNQ